MSWSDRVILHECRDFAVELSDFELHDKTLVPFIHLDVTYWSPSVLRQLVSVWSRLRPSLPPILFAQATDDDARITKLVKYFGFKFHCVTPCDDGLSRRIFVNYRE